jgi:hypothetical protein
MSDTLAVDFIIMVTFLGTAALVITASVLVLAFAAHDS